MTPTPTSTPTEIPVTPIAECVDVQTDGSLLAHFGYQNNGSSEVSIPVGSKNQFTPGNQDVGQPNQFFTGRVTDVFTVAFPSTSTLEWILGDASVQVSIATDRCAGDPITCTDTDIREYLMTLDGNAAAQRKIVRRLANRILSTTRSSALQKQAKAYLKAADDLYVSQWTAIWSSFSVISKNCSNCAAVDKQPDIQALSTRSQSYVTLSQQVLRTLRQSSGGRVSTSSLSLNNQVATLHQSSVKTANSLPRFESNCN